MGRPIRFRLACPSFVFGLPANHFTVPVGSYPNIPTTCWDGLPSAKILPDPEWGALHFVIPYAHQLPFRVPPFLLWHGCLPQPCGYPSLFILTAKRTITKRPHGSRRFHGIRMDFVNRVSGRFGAGSVVHICVSFLHLYHFLWVCFVCLGPVGRLVVFRFRLVFVAFVVILFSVVCFFSLSINQLSQALCIPQSYNAGWPPDSQVQMGWPPDSHEYRFLWDGLPIAKMWMGWSPDSQDFYGMASP